MNKYETLRDYFGYNEFRSGQAEIIDSLTSHKDTLAVMPTGAGKSLCYQIPALMFPGVTLVVSPLISLMHDQVTALCQSGVRAAYINSTLTPRQYGMVLDLALAGQYKIIYVAPERLSVDSFVDVFTQIDISMIAVDEAHCVSQWGQDFRPNYLKIVDFIDQLPKRPVVGAFTATATDEVKEDICRILRLNDPFVKTTGFDRPNLYFSVERIRSGKTKDARIVELVTKHREQSGIIYCATRKSVESLCDLLTEHGFSATRYHAGLSDEERRENQEDFVYDRRSVIVATNAFGMGIDKSDVSYVIHYNMPKNIESYYQEAGRAGRDGSPAECILLYSPKDVQINKFLIENSEPNPELSAAVFDKIREKDYERLKFMTFYCTTSDCLRRFILEYFGEKPERDCGNCSNCNTDFVNIDITREAQMILSCIVRTGERFGVSMISSILRGSKNGRILDFGLDKQTTYGLMSELPTRKVRRYIDELVSVGALEITDEDFPILKLGEKADGILFRGERISMKEKRSAIEENAEERKPRRKDYSDVENPYLLARLKALRSSIATEERVPAYVIFTDASLIDMCRKMPSNDAEFLEVSGVGQKKLARYGEHFMDVIRESLGSVSEDAEAVAPSERSDAGSFSPGDRVRHAIFGEGVIVSSEVLKNETLYTIDFESVGLKKLTASYARLVPLK